ncbi:MAG: SBBP repeat-containing protein [Bacteroidota bacterium]
MKKTLLYHILFFCLILSLKTYSQEQILVQKEWLSSTGNLDTIPYSATAMDSHGNLIVVGNTLYAGQVNNILITKYDDEGAIIWERQINGQDNGKDFGTGLYIDTDNNIFVTGVIFSDATNYDYIIAKYAPNGNLYWTNIFNGVGNNYDLPVAITGNGNYCYVTGTSFSSTSLTDFATLQLNADDGTINWVRTYNYSNGYELPVGLVLKIY